MELFQRLNDQGSTIGFVTHEDDIAQFSKRTVLLKDGHIISDKEVTDRLNAKRTVGTITKIRMTNDGANCTGKCELHKMNLFSQKICRFKKLY